MAMKKDQPEICSCGDRHWWRVRAAGNNRIMMTSGESFTERNKAMRRYERAFYVAKGKTPVHHKPLRYVVYPDGAQVVPKGLA